MMPLFPESEVIGNQARLQIDQPRTDAPGWADTLGAAFRAENSVGSAISAYEYRRPDENDPDFDPFANIKGYEQYAGRFIGANSPADVAAIKDRVTNETKDRETLHASGWKGVVSGIAAGVLDPAFLPLMFTPIGMIRAGAGPLRTAAATAGVGTAAATASELALHASQITRTPMESAFNITGAAVLSGILGGAAGAITRARFNELAKALDADISNAIQPSTVGAAATRGTTLAEETLVSTGGVAKVLKGGSPLLRTMQSASLKTRQVAQDLIESPLLTSKNEAGIANPVAVETLIKSHDARVGAALEQLDTSFVAYRTGAAGGMGKRAAIGAMDILGDAKRSGSLNFREFREQVGIAMRHGDTHDIPQVADAARSFRKLLFDPHKNASIELGLLAADVKAVGARSYLSRVYKTEVIKQRRGEFRSILERWVKSSGVNDATEARAIADDIIDNILHHPAGKIPGDIVPKAGPLKERVLTIQDDLIKDFLESDIEIIARHYNRTMAPEIELVRKFGSKDMKEQMKQITNEYQALIGKAKSPKESKALNDALDADLRDLTAMRDIMLGTYGSPADPGSLFVRSARVIRNVNFLRMLGGMTVSSIPDIANPIFRHGLRRWGKALTQLATSPAQFKMAREEVKAAGAGWDMVLNSRAHALADIGDMYGIGTALERGIRRTSDTFSVATLMAPWNASMKQFAGVMTSHRVLQESAGIASGKASKAAVRNLAHLGIDDQMAKRIATEFGKHGEKGDVLLGRPHLWTDREAAQTFRAAILKDADSIIVTPGAGDLPLVMRTETGRIIGQFKSFAFATVNRLMLARIQQRDMAVMNGMLVSTALGALVYGLKAKEVSSDPAVILKEAIDRSGMVGYLFDVNNIVEKATRGSVGVSALMGGKPMSRYASRNVLGALLGPTADTIQDMSQIIGATATGDFKQSDTHAVRKLLPYQNLFYLRALMDAAEQGVNESLGVRK